MGKLDQRVAIVTGGGTGIGQSIALEFAKAGADVVVASRNLGNLEKVVAEIKALGRRSLAVVTDVRVAEQIRNMARRTVEEFGRIDILVNNSGITYVESLVDLPEDEWDDLLDTNLKSVFLCTQAVAKYMIEQKYGKIINIASVVGIRSYGEGRSSPYRTSKAGVIKLTQEAAVELGRYGVNVNSISPGFIWTELAKKAGLDRKEWSEKHAKESLVGRVGQPQEIASLALFLASDDSSFICGENIVIDGGLSVRCGLY